LDPPESKFYLGYSFFLTEGSKFWPLEQKEANKPTLEQKVNYLHKVLKAKAAGLAAKCIIYISLMSYIIIYRFFTLNLFKWCWS
jgi:hypothetical protein